MGLLSQALKNFFPLNNGDNDFTSSCKIPYFNASNNPYGCVSPSKLASVLGATVYSSSANSSSLVVNLENAQPGMAYHIYVTTYYFTSDNSVIGEYIVSTPGPTADASRWTVLPLRTPDAKISSLVYTSDKNVTVTFSTSGFYRIRAINIGQ